MGQLEKQRFKGEKFKILLWDVVNCPNEDQLKGKLKAIKLESNEAYEDFINRGPKSFYKAYIETLCKYDMTNNNICETFNFYTMKRREKSLIEILEYVRENLMEMMEKQVRLVKRVKVTICPRISKNLECIQKSTSHCSW